MSQPAAVYSSDHPTVLAWSEDAKARRQDFREAVEAFMVDYSPRQALIGKSWQNRYLQSITRIDRNDCPVGWRHSARGDLVPNKRLKAGKLIADQVEKCKESIPNAPGTMDLLIRGDHWHHPGFRDLGGKVWLLYAVDPDDPKVDRGFNKVQQVDSALWTREPLSVYYALLEAYEATHAV